MLANFSHVYALPGLYNVSIEGQILWSGAYNFSRDQLVDIVSWGDGFLIAEENSNCLAAGLFERCSNLRVSAPSNTQPVFLSGASLAGMFASTSFNSSLDWDLANVTDLSKMFSDTPLNQPINFRNTQEVRLIAFMFYGATKFNQPFHFDASGLVHAIATFLSASNFNQVVNLTNSSKLINTPEMFGDAISFNQPITFNIESVQNMEGMFRNATSFNQPINFQASSQVTYAPLMFSGATSFNQPVAMDTSSITDMTAMFKLATSFASTVNFTSTALVTDMTQVFYGVSENFDQDLSSWDTSNVTQCSDFCKWCGLPSFPQCVPCPTVYNYSHNPSVFACSTTLAPTSSPTSSPTTRSPTASSVSAAVGSLPPSSSRGLLVAALLLGGAVTP